MKNSLFILVLMFLLGCNSKNDKLLHYNDVSDGVEIKLKIIPFETEKTKFDLNDSISSFL